MAKLSRRLMKNKAVAILRYHAVVEPAKNYYASQGICLAPDLFETQIRFLAENYNIINLDAVADCIRNRKPFPDQAVVLTFDDGYRDNFHAYQILNRYKVTGTFYVVAGCLDADEPLWLPEVIYLINKTKIESIVLNVKSKQIIFSTQSPFEKKNIIRKITEIIKSNNRHMRENIRRQLRHQIQDVPDFHEKSSKVMLTWKQVREMADNGMCIGGHTLTHLNLPNADYADAVHEIGECKRLIEEKTAQPVRHFSYPNGGNYEYYNEAIKNAVREAGYITSTTSNNGVADLNSDLLELSRIRITNHLSEIIYQMDCEPLVNKIFGTA